MLNHLRKGLDQIYDQYDLEYEKGQSFLLWENIIIIEKISHNIQRVAYGLFHR
jgi:hypothetical protein